ncbi:thiamine pyrophosphate-dependent enzyme [Brevibacterium sp. JSBI002]|uniref:thiamine pyrophosphate-dependent enzyme n=1 Tax=Brevibacterium sp. JSBI002 TaxID=2886045 RepID=UPI00222FC2F9|nr:thiamine pyrophosphate-dependent enzyme [Brevibacterium sp. JSBI002]UZD62233.1 thiamine pyrophosphate-binding protein [Brevibacterium sp. JSBI002]
MSRSAGHLIVDTLEKAGIERVYAVPGESYLDVLDGLYDANIETVVCRQEGGAGFMALAESRLTGRPGIAMVTRGPGAANAMISVHTAWQDATALVLFVGLVPLNDRSRESFQEFSLPEWFSSTAKRVLTIDDEDRAGEITADALRIAASGRPGPVVVGLPEDVLVGLTEAPTPTLAEVAPPTPAPVVIDGLASRIAAAKRPAFVLGGDGWHNGCGAELAGLAASAGVPIFCDWRAYDAIPHSSPAWAGWLGYGRADAVAAGFAEADLVVFIGCTRSDVLSDGYTIGFDAETVLVSLDMEATQHAGRIDEHIIATPDSFTRALTRTDAGNARDGRQLRGGRTDEWMQGRADAQSRFAAHRPDAEAAAENPGRAGVDLGVAFGILDDRLGGDAILTFGAGNATIWGHRFIRHERPSSLVGARNGAMGLAVPAAVAASLAYPERHAVAVCGDGDFLMNGQEIATAFAHGGSPLIIVVDNGVYGTIVSHQENHYPGRPSGTRMVNPNFAAWMSAFDLGSSGAASARVSGSVPPGADGTAVGAGMIGHGERVETTEDFGPALDRALAHDGPALIHVLIDSATMPPAADETS